jgi:WD40 repeat protein
MAFQLSQAVDLLPPLYLNRSTLFSLDDSYIYDVNANSSHVIVSASNNQIKLYNPVALSIALTLDFHTDKISKILTHGDHMLFSASTDGSLARWDLRTPSAPAQVFKGIANQTTSFNHIYQSTDLITSYFQRTFHCARLISIPTMP